MSDAVRVLIADGNEAVAGAVKQVLEEDRRIQVVATATTGAETLRKAMVARPLVLVMDLRFPDMPASQVITQLSTCGMPLAVLILSLQANKGAAALTAALEAGAFEFVKRPANYREIDQIGRQIRTHVLVAAVTRSKHLAQRTAASPAEQAAAASALALQGRAPQAVYFELGPARLGELGALLGRLPGKPRPAVLVRVRAPADAVLVTTLQAATKIPVYAASRGDYLVNGRVCLVFDHPDGLALTRTLSGFLELAGADAPTALVESLATLFGQKLAGVIADAPDGASQATLARAGALLVGLTDADLAGQTGHVVPLDGVAALLG